KELGVQLAIDDFGAGYSSLSYLRRFPVDALKIDRAFISRMEQDVENLEIVRTIMELARNLGIDVIAEGAETPSEISRLKTLHCEYAQGFYFAKPLDASSVENLLKQQSCDAVR